MSPHEWKRTRGGRHVSTFRLLDPDHFKLRDMAGVTPPTRVGYCYDPRMREHKHLGYDHPEQPARITSIFETLENSGCTSRMIVLPAREVSEDEVTLVHSRRVWERVNEIECKIFPPSHRRGAYSVVLPLLSDFTSPALRWLSIPAPCSDDHDTDTKQIQVLYGEITVRKPQNSLFCSAQLRGHH